MVVFDHACDSEIFKHNRSETIDQLSALLMRKILTSAGYALMNTGNHVASFGACRRTLFFLAQFPLRTRQVVFITTEEAWIRDCFSGREGGELRKTHIYADNSFRYVCLRLWFFLNRETDKPLPNRRTAQGNGLNLSFHWTMQIDFYWSNLTQDKHVTMQFHAISILGIGDTIVAPLTFKSRVSYFFFASFHTTKEGFECKIYSYLHILENLRMNVLQRRTFSFPFREQVDGVIQPKRFVTFFPGITSGGKRLVIHPPARLKLLFKQAVLTFGKPEAILVYRFMLVVHSGNCSTKPDRMRVRLKRLKRVKPFYPRAKAPGFYGLYL